MPWWRYEPIDLHSGVTYGYLKGLAEGGEADALMEWLDTPAAREDPVVRRRIVLAMAHMKPEGGSTILKPVLDPRFFEIFCEMAQSDSDTDVRRIAIMGLAFSEDEGAVPILLSALRDTDGSTRGWAVIGVGNFRVKEAVEPLIGLLRPWRKGTFSAVVALVEIRNERAIQPLREAANATWLPWRRRRLQKAAGKLERSVGITPWK